MNNKYLINWISNQKKKNLMNVIKTSSSNVDNWKVGEKKIYNLKKAFFSILPFEFKIKTKKWHQPLIIQKEVGILGILKKKIKGALMYPSVMFSVAIVVMVFMLIKVVPVFAKMYEGMGVALPTPTAAIMTASDFMRGTGGMVTFITLAVAFAIFKYTTSKMPNVRYAWHKQVLKLPVFGDMILKSLIARVSLIMGNLSSAGVNLLESIEIAKQVSNNDVVTLALENVKKGVFSGDTLTKLFAKEPVFPPTFSQLVSVGEQTGNLDEMFTSVSRYYEEEFDTAVDNMSSLIEPIMIVFMGTMIGGLMIAMYSPIFNVGAIVGG